MVSPLRFKSWPSLSSPPHLLPVQRLPDVRLFNCGHFHHWPLYPVLLIDCGFFSTSLITSTSLPRSFSLSFFPLTMSHCRRWRPVAPALCAHQAQNWPPFSSFSFVPASRPFSPSCSGGHSGGQRYGSQCVCQPVSTVHRIDVVFVVVQQQYSVVFSRLAFPLFLPLSFTTNNSQWKCVSTLCWTG